MNTAQSAKLFVVDAGPLIALAVAQILPLVLAQYGGLIVPQAVLAECLTNAQRPGAESIRAVLESQAITVIPQNEIRLLDPVYASGLGSGEQAVLAYALQRMNHGTEQLFALIDDERARKLALRLHVRTARTGTILLDLKSSGRLKAIKPAIQAWRKHGYFVRDDVVAALLARAEENVPQNASLD